VASFTSGSGKPIVQFGKELGGAYVEMIRICQRLKVPRPEPGYWYRLQHAGPQEQTPLPPAEPETPLEVTLQPKKRVAALDCHDKVAKAAIIS